MLILAAVTSISKGSALACCPCGCKHYFGEFWDEEIIQDKLTAGVCLLGPRTEPRGAEEEGIGERTEWETKINLCRCFLQAFFVCVCT